MRVLQQITFEARDDAEAMRIAGERLGRDAVVLSTRPVRTGGFLGFFRKTVLLVSAGVLEEEKREGDESKRERMMAFQKLLEARKALSESAVSQTPIPATAGTSEPLPPPASTDDGDTLRLSREGLALATSTSRKAYESLSGGPAPSKLEHEVSELSRRLSEVIRHIEEERESPPDHDGTAGNSPLLAKLLGMEVSPQRARTLVERYARENDGRTFPEWLAARVKATGTTPADSLGGRRVMFVGPTGVGKTTTIAKLAAISALWERRKVLLLTADTYRIAAVEQLRTYAKILGVPMEVIFEPETIDEVLTKHQDADLVLLDTAGRSQKDTKRVDELSSLYGAFRPDAVHLLIAANMKYRDMLEVVRKTGVVPVTSFLFTKIDETSTYGALLDIVEDFDRPVSFLTTGQNVPNDIEVASGVRFADLLLMPGNIGDG
jgi:flagellar biosynthesis protein FlhF